ncbi:MAG: lysylphosphatidylglycerol synthase transmembrane domain-containing protein [Erysipelotrichaceae bacterium]
MFKKLTKNIWFNVIFIIILACFALVFALYDSYQVVFDRLSHLEYWKIPIIIAWGVAPYLVYALILKIFALPFNKKYKFVHGLINGYVGAFMSGITPSSTGGQFAQAYTYKKHGLTASQGAGLIWMDFYINQLVLVGITLTLYLLKITSFSQLAITFVFGIGVAFNVFVFFLLWLMIYFPKLYQKITRGLIQLLSYLKFIKNKESIIEGFNTTMGHFLEAIQTINQDKKTFWIVTFLYVIKLLLYFSTAFGIGQLLGLQFFWKDYVELLALSSFVTISNTFVPLPGASGATESIFVLVFSTVIGKAAAATTMILWRFTNFFIPVLIGGILFIRLKRTDLIKAIDDEAPDSNHSL